MRDQFYHDGPHSPVRRSRAAWSWLALIAVAVSACGRPAPAPNASTPAPAPANLPTAAPSSSDAAATPTAAAVARGRALLEQLRAAAGGAALTNLRSFEVTGTSVMPGARPPRRLTVIARYPLAFRFEEAGIAAAKVPGPLLAIGVTGDQGWMVGAALGGDGQSKDRAVAQRAYTRAARQTMAGFMAGINAPWLVDTGRFTASDGGVVESGPDQGATQILLDGPDGRVGRLVLDPTSHLPRRLIEPPQPSGGGPAAVADIVYTYSDFQVQGGVSLPKTIARTNASVTTTWTISSYALNKPIAAARFTPRGR